jgi:hypothetical protein
LKIRERMISTSKPKSPLREQPGHEPAFAT